MAQQPPSPPVSDAPRPRKSSEERNAEIREALRPIGPDERPLPLLIAVAVAVALGLVNIVLLVVGQTGKPEQLLVYCAVILCIAYGMWTKSYLAVLGFQILLAIGMIVGFLFAFIASSPLDWVICFLLVVPTGWLFWKLIRVLARLQTPVQEPPDER